ncbi:uncharacterized protein Dana_GF28138 [Drosophila ananassae]|uniref:Uncharacterized protein n=1 Tax=Drosophila ananassae TaxID=7217 RepID=A0A0P8Y1W1_DROAN|nr:uncharacterized protein Dana_GF28138 [Drosophila ananassae]
MKLSRIVAVLIMIFKASQGHRRRCPHGQQWNPKARKCVKFYFGP